MKLLRGYLVGMICSLAFEDAIPQLDLVLTSTGFGVVSNQNVAPASADRVKALKTRIHNQGGVFFEEAIRVLCELGIAGKSAIFDKEFRTLFWHRSHLHVFGIPNPTHDNLIEERRKVLEEQHFLIRFISPEMFEALTKVASTASGTPLQWVLMDMCRQYFACAGGYNKTRQRLSILRFMEQHPEDFKEYMNSQTYKANHFERYENKQDDPCFFFG